MSCLTIFCTEIAALIGRHPYRTLDEAIGALLLHNERVVHKEFPHLKTQLREARVKDAGGKKREFICRKRHGGVLESGLAKMAKAECPEEVRVLLDETLAEIDEPDERDVARGIVFKTFGTRNEDNVILEYERLTGRRLTEKNTDFRLSRAFSTPSGISYKIGGRIDGVCDELGKLVEVKNRIHKFHVPEYDVLQVYGYFAITGLKECELIQCMCGQLKTDKIVMDEDFWARTQFALDKFIDKLFSPDTQESGANSPREEELTQEPPLDCE